MTPKTTVLTENRFGHSQPHLAHVKVVVHPVRPELLELQQRLCRNHTQSQTRMHGREIDGGLEARPSSSGGRDTTERLTVHTVQTQLCDELIAMEMHG